MGTMFEKKDIVSFKNGMKFIVVHASMVDDVDYYLMREINLKTADVSSEIVVAKEEFVGDKFFLKILTDEKEIEAVLPHLKEAIENEKHD